MHEVINRNSGRGNSVTDTARRWYPHRERSDCRSIIRAAAMASRRLWVFL